MPKQLQIWHLNPLADKRLRNNTGGTPVSRWGDGVEKDREHSQKYSYNLRQNSPKSVQTQDIRRKRAGLYHLPGCIMPENGHNIFPLQPTPCFMTSLQLSHQVV